MAARHPFQPAPESGHVIPKAIACLEDTIRSVAPGASSIFIIGERGTRKEWVAQCVHAFGPRARQPFVSFSRPELTEEFVERQLFGLAGPAASGRGRLADAEGGSLFLDEVCDFSLATQARLARVLEARRSDLQQDGAGVRLIAASEREPEEAIRGQLLHPELYDYLRVFVVRVPALRDRKEEILDLTHDYLDEQARTMGRAMPRLSGAAISRLVAYHWPGNVRELEQTVDHALVVGNGEVIDEQHLPAPLRERPLGDADAPPAADTLQATLESVERALIEEALRTSRGNQAKAAHSLGITERLMGLRVRKYGIESRHYRRRTDH